MPQGQSRPFGRTDHSSKLRWSVALVVLILFSAVAPAAAQTRLPSGFIVFRPIETRKTPTDFSKFDFVKPGLRSALQNYQTDPSMGTACGVLKFFTTDFYKLTPDQRNALFQADPDLFLSVDIAKYELVMQARIETGAQQSRRVGSSGQREKQIIDWVWHNGPKPGLDPNKQFVSDDDVTNLTNSKDLLADEAVNEEKAKKAFQDVVARYQKGVGSDQQLTTADLQLEFLSPTKAWQVFRAKYGSQIPRAPEYLYAWTASNPEKYNDPFGVYMLDVWGYDKGVVTKDVNDPVNSTVSFSEFYDRPGDPPSSGMFSYIANNYRQIYGVHHGRFQSECKYLVRMIDAWIAVHGMVAIGPDWNDIRNQADAIYKKGPEFVQGSSDFEKNVGNYIDSVVTQAHEYQLERVAAELDEVSQELKKAPPDQISMSDFAKYPQLMEELNGLAIAYTNTPLELRQKLLDQFQARIQTGAASGQNVEIFKSYLFEYMMEVVQNETQFQTDQIDAFVGIRQRITANLSESLTSIDLQVFIEDVAKGQFTGKGIPTLKDGRIVREDVHFTPEQVLQQIQLIDAVSNALGLSSEQYTQKVKDYFAQGPGVGIQMLQKLCSIFDSVDAQTLVTSYQDQSGATIQKELVPSGARDGLLLFKFAIKGGNLALKGGEWWGHVQNGVDLFRNMDKLLHRGGMSDLEIGQAQAALFFNLVNFNNLVSSWKVTGSAVLGMSTVSNLVSNAGAIGVTDEDTNQFLYGILKDLVIAKQPHLAGAIILLELGEWGYKQWSLTGEKNDLIDAMVQNGVWDPADYKGLSKLNGDDLPNLTGVRPSQGADPKVPKALATTDFGTLTVSSNQFDPWEKLLDVAYDGNYMDSDPVITADKDALNNISGSYWQRFFHAGTLPSDARKWERSALDPLGIVISRTENDRTTPLDPSQISIATQENCDDPSQCDMASGSLRLTGYLMADYWIKRQKILEEAVLPGLIKEAARRYLDKLKADEASAGSYDYMKQVDDIYDLVRKVDAKLWDRVAHPATPFAAVPDSDIQNDPDLERPILKNFQADNRVKYAITEIKQLQDFMQLNNEDRITVFVARNGGSDASFDRNSAPKESSSAVTYIRQFYYGLKDGYDQVDTSLNQGNNVVDEGKIKVEPFYVGFDPNSWYQSFVGSLPVVGGPAAGDLKTAHNWIGRYQGQRKRVLKDVADKSKTAPPGSLLSDLGNQISSFLASVGGRDETQTYSPAHPLWPKLIHLRYEIQALQEVGNFADQMGQQEMSDVVTPMTIREGETVQPQSSDIADGSSYRAFLDQTKQKMEDEYQRLLASLMDMFQVALVVNPQQPFIGSELDATVTPQFDPDETQPDLNAATGFPTYVGKFRWTIDDPQGQLPTITETTDKPAWKTKVKKKGTYRTKIEVLDKGGNVVSTTSLDQLPQLQGLTLIGNVVISPGDYTDERLDLAVGGYHQMIDAPGTFSIDLDEYDEKIWETADARAQASASSDSAVANSNQSSIDARPDSGTVMVKDDLKIPLTSIVNVKVDVTDAANLPVPEAQVTIIANGVAQPVGNTARVRLMDGQTAYAAVTVPPLVTIWTSPVVTFKADSSNQLNLLGIQSHLPMLDTGHLTVSGRFVPDASQQPAPQLASGQITSDIGEASVDGQGMFAFTNDKPLDVSAGDPLQAQASLTDTAGKHYRPADKIQATIPSANKLDLGSINIIRLGLAKPIQVQLLDWTGKVIPASAGPAQVLIAGTSAPRSGDVFSGEYAFGDDNEDIIIEGDFTLPNGQNSTVQQHLSAQQVGGIQNPQPPPLYQFKLPFYLAGDLTLTGTTAVTDVPPQQSPPTTVHIEDSVHHVAGDAPSNGPFQFQVSVPVQVSEAFSLTASGSSGDLNYKGTGSVTAPPQPGSVDAGQISLSLTNRETACSGMGTPIRQQINTGDTDTPQMSIQSMQDFGCDTTGLQNLLNQTLASINGLIDGINQAVNQCQYQNALGLAQSFQQTYPANPWVQTGLPGIQQLVAKQAAVNQLLTQAQQHSAQPDTARSLIANARQAADPDSCLLNSVNNASTQLENTLKGSDSGNSPPSSSSPGNNGANGATNPADAVPGFVSSSSTMPTAPATPAGTGGQTSTGNSPSGGATPSDQPPAIVGATTPGVSSASNQPPDQPSSAAGNTNSGVPSPSDQPPAIVGATTPGSPSSSNQPPLVVDNTTPGTSSPTSSGPLNNTPQSTQNSPGGTSGTGQNPGKKSGFMQGLGTLLGSMASGMSQNQPSGVPPSNVPPGSPPAGGQGGGTNQGQGGQPPYHPPVQPGKPANQPTQPTSPAGSAPLRIKFIVGVSCSASDTYTSGLGGVSVSLVSSGGTPSGSPVVTDSSGVARSQVLPGNYTASVSASGATLVSVNYHRTAANDTGVRLGPGAFFNFVSTSNPGSMSEYEVAVRMSSPSACH